MNKTMQNRNSSFEIVKVIGILCICICHSVPTGRIEYHYATTDTIQFCVMMMRQLGSIGNAIFIVVSTWFLVDSDKVDFFKVKKMILDNWTISVLVLFVMTVWGGYSFSLKLTFAQFFPFLFNILWYVNCYILYYCTHGIINQGLKGLNISPFKAMSIIFALLFLVFITGGGSLYYNDLTGFLLLHAFTFYLKAFISNINIDSNKLRGICIFSILLGGGGWIVGAVFFNFIGTNISFFGAKFHWWNRYFNPFILFLSYGAIVLSFCTTIHNRTANHISGLSLFIYMITGNQLIRGYFDDDLYDAVCFYFGDTYYVCLIFVIIYGIVKFILGLFVSDIYRLSISKLTNKLSHLRGVENNISLIETFVLKKLRGGVKK